MSRTRILVADDSVVIRRMLTNLLSEENDLEVVGTAPDGRLALDKIPQTNPDILVLDVEMPNLNGLETLQIVRERYQDLPVIMFSSFTKLGAEATIDALLLGARDYVEKPSTGHLEESIRRVKDNLVPKIRALGKSREGMVPAAALVDSSVFPPKKPRGRKPKAQRVDLVVIGVSTGGPTALADLFSKLPVLPVPILIVQHMPPFFTTTLAQRLSDKSVLNVREAGADETLSAGMVRLAPGDYHLAVRLANGLPQIWTFQGPIVNSCRPSVDVLFQSAAAVYGENTLGIILTGMGQDGLKGCEQIVEQGGQVLAQDEATSVVWGMPGEVARAGLAEKVLPLGEIAPEILRRVAFEREGFFSAESLSAAGRDKKP
jgi:two-component system, chemotaxis family, protein-glutamate methylesterase/glutaminase